MYLTVASEIPVGNLKYAQLYVEHIRIIHNIYWEQTAFTWIGINSNKSTERKRGVKQGYNLPPERNVRERWHFSKDYFNVYGSASLRQLETLE